MDLNLTVGVDEVGWGALAGPLVTCAVFIPAEYRDWVAAQGFRDSKDLSAPQRAHLVAAAKDKVIHHIAAVDASTFDEIGPGPTWHVGMRHAVRGLAHKLGAGPLDRLRVVVDGAKQIDGLDAAGFDQIPIPQADATVLECAVASVFGKVHRDAQMGLWGDAYAAYGFRSHKGYGTRQHWEVLATLGPLVCPHYLHRLSYLTSTKSRRTLAKHNHGTVPSWALRRPL